MKPSLLSLAWCAVFAGCVVELDDVDENFEEKLGEGGDPTAKVGALALSARCARHGAGVVEEDSACVTLGGPTRFLRAEAGGSAGAHVWTGTTARASPTNFARYDLNLAEAGRYEVAAFVVGGTARAARYSVTHAGVTDTVVVDQSSAVGPVSLGIFDFAAGAEQPIILGDNTGARGQRLVFDALRLVRVSAPVVDASCAAVEVVSDAAVNVRPSASTTQAPLGQLHNGDVVARLDTVVGQTVRGTSEWHHITKGSLTGYISAAFARCVDAAAEVPPDPVVSVPGNIWRPQTGTSWQWQLLGAVDRGFDVEAYDVDLFDVTDADMDALKSAGRTVICYFSAGTFEPWRSDVGHLPNNVKGGSLDPPFGDELWLDTNAAAVRELVKSRLDLAVRRGCDAVEPDNVDGYQNNHRLGLNAASQLAFNRFVADEAHARGLSVGLKNDLDQLAELEPHFDWALNEECVAFDECGVYVDNFVAANKAVFHAEYVAPGQRNRVCTATRPFGLSTIVKDILLTAPMVDCR